jgi:hypothetical protein
VSTDCVETLALPGRKQAYEDHVLLAYDEVAERDFEGMSGVPLDW